MRGTTEARAVAIRKFNRFYTNILGLVNQTILESSYSLAEGRVLLEIQLAGQCTASYLVKMLQIDPGYLSRILGRFRREELVAQVKSPADGRVQLLALTEKGHDTMNHLSGSSTREIVKLLENLPEGDQAALVGHMRAVQDILACEEHPITIRSYQPGDAGYIAYRHGVLYEKEYGLDQVFERYVLKSLTEFLENPDGQIWIAESGGRIAGFIAIVGVDQDQAQLRWFLIEPECRGQGLGRRLVSMAMEYCRQQQYKHVFLWTFVGLDAARHLYKSFGFEPTEQVENNTWRSHLIEERWDVFNLTE